MPWIKALIETLKKIKRTKERTKRIAGWLVAAIFLVLLFILYPVKSPFKGTTYSTILTDRNGYLLGGLISEDQQWRFPIGGVLPGKYKAALIEFEDGHYYRHPGIDPIAIVRAAYINLKEKRIVSGGSTITMQVARLSRGGRKRLITEKFIEAIIAVKYELMYSKEKIIMLYAGHAPFGGNVVGLEAACWRYFGRSPETMSWAEASLMAILPNSPAMIYPGKNEDALIRKRNRLLKRLHNKKRLTDNEYNLAIIEPLPDKPYPMPQIAYHLLNRLSRDGYTGMKVRSTIDENTQIAVEGIINRNGKRLAESRIFNAAAIVVNTDTGEVIAYSGNTQNVFEKNRGNSVDIITAPRSSGSILKPFLYGFMIDDGELLPDQLVPDIPLNFRGFAPQNYAKDFNGAIKASEALTRSLNVPFVYLLHRYGYQKFHARLKQVGFTLPFSPAHYSLSLILGGAETTLWELSAAYAGIARTVKSSSDNDRCFFSNSYILDDIDNNNKKNKKDINKRFFEAAVSPAAFMATINAMKEVARPNEENRWREFTSSKPIAWKTGTSYGNRDAWAVGITPDYVIAVWVGNASGEGRPEITGVTAAGPLMLEIHNYLPDSGWFTSPYSDMTEMMICSDSGFIASRFCENRERKWLPRISQNGETCPYHRIVHLDKEERFQVNRSNYSSDEMITRSAFVLPPIQEYYFIRRNPAYRKLPPVKDGESDKIMGFVYPNTDQTRIFIPVELDGTRGRSVFHAVHRNPGAVLYWHLDGNYLGETINNHQMSFSIQPGKYELTIVDTDGNYLIKAFEVVDSVRQ